MSLYFLRETVESLRADYGTCNIILSKYVLGPIDFKTANVQTNDIAKIEVKGIALPRSINTMFLSKTKDGFTWDKNSRNFILLSYKNLSDWVREGQYIVYRDKHYNIKSSESVEDMYYYVQCTSVGNEEHNEGAI